MPWQPHVPVPPDELAQVTCARLAAVIGDMIEERGGCHVAVSGGSTPLAAWDPLASMPLPWPAVHVWQVDERVAPAGDPERNAVGLVERLTDPISLPAANLHLMPVESDDLEAAAAAYTAELAAACDGSVLDVVHLGLGADGHTASWVPGDPVCDVDDRDVALTTSEYQGTRRMTLTVPCVNRARMRLLAVGGDKAAAVSAYLAADGSIPASRLSPLTTLLDATGAF